MSYTIEDYQRDYLLEHVDKLSPEERLKGLSSDDLLKRLTPDDMLKTLTPDDLLRGLTMDDLLKWIKKLKKEEIVLFFEKLKANRKIP